MSKEDEMISKEEIEKDKQQLQNLAEDVFKCEDNELIGIDAYAAGSFTRILKYIEKLETEKENLIRKLEEKIKEHKERIKPYQNKINLNKIEKDYIERLNIKIEVLQEYLKIMKGENDEYKL